ncbi:MAG: hypothetical protein AUK48_11575 [Oscillatoriales cyanobacterium CG2_30_44_21]|nr:MAG: hypothetical protein AUK48_11575 [Oscillatoriales cyanobacterium CG2_30_44_21]
MNQHKLFVCVLCRFSETEKEHEGLRGGQHLFNALSEKLEGDDRLEVEPVKCMGACDRSCVVAFRGADKYTFIFSDLQPLDSAPDVVQFSQQYLEHPTGAVPYQERPEAIKRKLFVILPPS